MAKTKTLDLFQPKMRAKIEKLEDERDRLAEFVKFSLEKLWTGDNLEATDCQSKALELGLVFEDVATEEDSERNWYTEPGEPWYRLVPWLEEIEPVSGH